MPINYHTENREIFIRPQSFFQKWEVKRSAETVQHIESTYIGYVPIEDLLRFRHELAKLETQLTDDSRNNRLNLLDLIGKFDKPKITEPNGHIVKYVEDNDSQIIDHQKVRYIINR